ncbi:MULTISPECIES: CHAD domain-containing protein [Burkholderiaceae]|uniref:CHAD domain-containing protein n=1 Tax=Burkholderiaceae TaxID=119060 RepID=UPI00097699D0|nr:MULTISPECIES: CHAD domain-containing protein [Burkholderiaceae]MCF2133526.1 CHAD domain-containing protein [Mycetohabitans sp. B3]MCG1018180.1 CHAD domain-containing protein [Mycetohabitans sp. B4]MCG1039075.1 CHAD domain-containing protein [Mycetohabitans sp. B7]
MVPAACQSVRERHVQRIRVKRFRYALGLLHRCPRAAQWRQLSVASAIQSALGAGNDAVIALQLAARLLLGDMQRGFIRDYAAARQSINAAPDPQLSPLEWPKPAKAARGAKALL